MRVLYLLSLLYITACNHKSRIDSIQLPSENSKFIQVKFIDSLGNVTLSIPARYDTFFSWTHHSDCGKPCDKIKYRFQPKSLNVMKESGWIWSEPKDSIEEFTISHSGDFPFHHVSRSDDSILITQIHEHKKRNLLNSSDTYKIKSDTIEKIGDRYFSIVIIDLYDSLKSQYSKKLLASAEINSNVVDFNFELLTKRKDSLTDNFINNSKYFLTTIRISSSK